MGDFNGRCSHTEIGRQSDGSICRERTGEEDDTFRPAERDGDFACSINFRLKEHLLEYANFCPDFRVLSTVVLFCGNCVFLFVPPNKND